MLLSYHCYDALNFLDELIISASTSISEPQLVEGSSDKQLGNNKVNMLHPQNTCSMI